MERTLFPQEGQNLFTTYIMSHACCHVVMFQLPWIVARLPAAVPECTARNRTPTYTVAVYRYGALGDMLVPTSNRSLSFSFHCVAVNAV